MTKENRSGTFIAALYIALGLFYVSLSMHLPLSIYTTAGHDDAWFIRNAERMASGGWLGPYNYMTLIKGPAYSIFLAVNNLIGFPVSLSTSLLYLGSCATTVFILKHMGLSRGFALALFALLLLQPALLSTRVIRDNIYCALTLLTFSGVAYTFLPSNIKKRGVWIGLLGVASGLFWLTREEGIWILPGLFSLVIFGTYVHAKNKTGTPAYLKGALLYVACAALPLLFTAFVNFLAYGSFQIVDVKDSAYVRALGSLNSVSVGDEVPYVPVPRKKREAIYRVSPAFRELEPYFERDGNGWVAPGCQIYPSTCGDYAGGWFMWAFREGVGRLGYYSSPKNASAYFERLVEEIEAACSNGSLSCSKSPLPYVPRLPPGALASIPEKTVSAIRLTLYRTEVPLSGGPSSPPLARLERMRDFLGNPRIEETENNREFEISGWYYNKSDEWMELACSSGAIESKTMIPRQDSPDIAQHFTDSSAGARRFSVTVKGSEDCAFVFSGSTTQRLPLTGFLAGSATTATIANGVLHIDRVRSISHKAKNSDWSPVKSRIIALYSKISMPIVAVGFISFIISMTALLLGKRRLDTLLVASACFWTMYAFRLAVVIMVDVTSFPGVNHLYLMPAFPVLFAGALTAVCSLWAVAKPYFARQPPLTAHP